jgi:hypothetical protein
MTGGKEIAAITGLRDRAAAFFVAPARPATERLTAVVPAETRAVVLGASRDAAPLAAAVALTLRAAERSPTALVATWHGRGGDDLISRGAATRSASQLAARLSGRDLPAVARGRLAWLPLPDDPAAAAEALRRATAAVHGPVVTALAGPRPAALDRLVEAHDLVVVAAEPGTALAEAALAALGGQCVSVVVCRPLPRGLSRALAVAGLTAPRLDPPLRAVRSGEAAPPPPGDVGRAR